MEKEKPLPGRRVNLAIDHSTRFEVVAIEKGPEGRYPMPVIYMTADGGGSIDGERVVLESAVLGPSTAEDARRLGGELLRGADYVEGGEPDKDEQAWDADISITLGTLDELRAGRAIEPDMRAGTRGHLKKLLAMVEAEA